MTETEPTTKLQNEDGYPAVEPAFGFVLPSYQLLVTRFESSDNRLQSLLTTAATLTLAAPLLGRAVNPTIEFGGLFLAALLTFAALAILGIVARVKGGVKVPDPGVLYDAALHETVWEFRKNAIHYAGEHFRANRTVIERKRLYAVWMSGLLILEILILAAWMAMS